VVEAELIGKQMRSLVDMENSGMVPMLQQDKHADLSRMHQLFKRVPEGVDLLRSVRSPGLPRLLLCPLPPPPAPAVCCPPAGPRAQLLSWSPTPSCAPPPASMHSPPC
jgi:hypothetical protein